MPWTSLGAETTLLNNAVSSSPRLAMSTIGESVEGRPIRAVRIGNPPPQLEDRVDILFVGSQHGNEPAGRESLLGIIQDLGNQSGFVESLFAGLSVIIVPSANPDGFNAMQRNNANGIDLNRDWLSLSQPEARAISTLMGQCRPRMVIDQHESRNNIKPESDIEFRGAHHPNAYDGLNELSLELRDRLINHLDGQGWNADVYMTGGVVNNITQLDGHVNFRHSVTQLFESNFNPGWAPADRTTMQRLGVFECLRFATDRYGSITTSNESSVDWAASRGASANQPFVLRSTNNLDPPPVAYTLNQSQILNFQLWLNVLNIELGDDGRVSMAQPAWALIPVLIDSRSVDAVINALPINRGDDDDDDPPPPPPEGRPDIAVASIQRNVTWLAVNALTGRVIAELPDIEGNISRLISAHTSSGLTLPLSKPGHGHIPVELIRQATRPIDSAIVCVINDVPSWEGWVLSREAGTGADLRISTATTELYWTKRRVRNHNFTNRDKASIAAALLADAGDISGVGQGLAMEIDWLPTGDLVTREYLASDRITVYEALRELAAEGLDFTIDLDWTDHTHTAITRVVRIRDHIGVRTSTPPAFDSINGASYTLAEDYSEGRFSNYLVAYGPGEGEDQPASQPFFDAAALAGGTPIVERHWQPGNQISEVPVLNDHARSELALVGDGAHLWTLSSRLDAYPRPNVDVRLGDDVAAQVTGHWHPDGVRFSGRLVGWRADPHAQTWEPQLLDPHDIQTGVFSDGN